MAWFNPLSRLGFLCCQESQDMVSSWWKIKDFVSIAGLHDSGFYQAVGGIRMLFGIVVGTFRW